MPDSVVKPEAKTPPSAPVHEQHHETPAFRMFVNRPKVYPADVKGKWRNIKWAMLGVLLAIYYITPWIRWDRGPGIPDQAVLADMAGRRLYFFWIEIWPQEVYYLTGLLIMAAVGLFLVTSMAGRIWCAYGCWQTVWTDLFIWVERKIEGPRNDRIRLDKGPMTVEKLKKKLLKHAIWIVISVLTGGAWVFYFNDAPTLMRDILSLQVSSGVLVFVGIFGGFCYVLAGFGREQVCIYVCPWRSFQSAMVDEDTFLVTYESWRGDGRAPLRKSQSWEERKAEGLGDCIDCKMCVHVCPTGTDIRKGQQISCIGCGLCIDACNDVMRHIGRPENLVRFDTITNQNAAATGDSARVKLLRPRTIIYSLILVVVASAIMTSLMLRPKLDVSVLRDRAPLFVTLSDGAVQNAYTVKILNKRHGVKTFVVSFDGLPASARLSAANVDAVAADPAGKSLSLSADPDSVATYRLFIRIPAADVKSGSSDVTIRATEKESGEVGSHASVFIAP
jgi:cytochrome c oxidase accessory protein FixG